MSEKLSDHKSMSSSQLRRINKPLMEKKRRARINTCLVQLKSLVLEAMKKDPSRYSKLEKADILEMTVKHLRDIQRDRLAAAATTDPSVLAKYRTGFTECAKEVTRYLGNMDGIPTDVRGRLVEHLSGCVHGMNTVSSAHAGSVLPPGSRMPMQPIHVQIPATTPLGSLPGGPQHMHPLMTSLSSSTSPIQTVLTNEGTQIQGTFQIMPGVYPGSNSITVFVPSSQTSHPTSFSTGSSPRSPMSDISPCSSPEPGRITPERRPSEFQPRPVKQSPENRPPIRESAKHHIAQMLNNKMDAGKDKDVWRPW